MIVKNARTGKEMGITRETWERWTRMGLHRHWRVLSSDEPAKAPEAIKPEIKEFLGIKKNGVVEPAASKPTKKRYDRRNSGEGLGDDLEQRPR